MRRESGNGKYPLINFICLILFFIIFTLKGNPLKAQEKYTLTGAVDYAVNNNLNLKELRLNRALDDDILVQSKVNLLPNLNGTLSRFNSYGRSINPTTNTYFNNNTSYDQGQLNSQILIFGGFQKINTIRQNRYLLLSDQSNLEKSKNDVILNVITYYISILSDQDLIASGKDKLAVSQQTLEFDQKKLDAGTITEADYLNDKAAYDLDSQNLTTYQNNLDIAKINLANFMNLDPSKPFDLVRPDSINVDQLKTQYDPAEVFQKASLNLPDIRAAEFTALAYQKGLDIARGGLAPSLSLGGSYGVVYSPNYTQSTFTPTGQFAATPYITQNSKDPVLSPVFNTISSIIPFKDQLKNNITKQLFLSLSIPIFNGWQQHIAVKKANYAYQKSLMDKEIVKANLNKTIIQAILDLRAAEKSYYSSKSASEASKKAFNYSQIRYNVGLLNSLDYNLSKSKYSIAEATEIQNKYTYLFRAKVIDFYLGNPISL
jgi:outer membrane protein